MCVPTVERCDWFWGSHGCDLPRGHTGTHVCEPFDLPEGKVLYFNPPPINGWAWDDCCFKWEPGDPLEFQFDWGNRSG